MLILRAQVKDTHEPFPQSNAVLAVRVFMRFKLISAFSRPLFPGSALPGRMLLCACFLLSHFASTPLHADDSPSGSLARRNVKRSFVSTDTGTGSLNRMALEPLRLSGGSRVQIVAPKRWEGIARNASHALKELHARYESLFGAIPAFTTTVRLLDEETFYLTTGAPQWTNAMFYKGQIVIPLPKKGAVDEDNLIRSIKHEYTHAVIHALSGGKCPGWLDEGLAQWAEGSENPALRPALLQWLAENQPVPLHLLQGGFTKLDARMVPAAYAQSLYAAQFVLENYGFERLSSYFRLLRQGTARSPAFSNLFKGGEGEFEKVLRHELGKVALSSLE